MKLLDLVGNRMLFDEGLNASFSLVQRVGDVAGLQNNEMGVAFTQWHDLEPFLELFQTRIHGACFAARAGL